MEALEFVRRIRLTIEDLQQEGPSIVEEMAVTGKSIVQDRIQREGFGATYSNNYVPAFFLYGKELNARGKTYLDYQDDANDLTNWKELRQAQGLQTAFVDLTYSGRMWASITIVRSETALSQFRAYIGATDREGELKLLYNAAEYGDFLQPNPAEQIEIQEVAKNRLETIIKRRLT